MNSYALFGTLQKLSTFSRQSTARLEAVKQSRSLFTTTSIAIPIELPSVEEALLILAGASIKAGEAGKRISLKRDALTLLIA